jgi:hypothetical protein
VFARNDILFSASKKWYVMEPIQVILILIVLGGLVAYVNTR